MNSIKMMELIQLLDKKARIKVIGIRPGEKLHESLFSSDESRSVNQDKNSFIIYSENLSFKKRFGKKLIKKNAYKSSDINFLNKNRINSYLTQYFKKKN